MLQDSGILEKWLEEKGQEANRKLLLKRAPTSIIASESWLDSHIDYEKDAEDYIE
jgi:hypothetical protein